MKVYLAPTVPWTSDDGGPNKKGPGFPGPYRGTKETQAMKKSEETLEAIAVEAVLRDRAFCRPCASHDSFPWYRISSSDRRSAGRESWLNSLAAKCGIYPFCPAVQWTCHYAALPSAAAHFPGCS